MTLNKESVTRVVDSCYSSSYKIFSINSRDGINICKPLGLFVSLGITTSMKTMRKVAEELKISFGDYEMHISEIESRIVNGRYSNKVSKMNASSQFNSGSLSEKCMRMGKKEVLNLISELKSKLIKNSNDDKKVIDYSCRITKLSKILNKIDSGSVDSESYSIGVINTDDEFQASLINDKINYIQSSDEDNPNIIVHKRIGILIEFK